MSNGYIKFYPKRSIIAANPPTDDYYQINVEISTWDRTTDISKSIVKTMGGRRESSLFYRTHKFSVVLVPDSDDVTPEEMEMFFDSVCNNEKFMMTDIDRGSVEVEFQMESDFGDRTRPALSKINSFGYAFEVREVIA